MLSTILKTAVTIAAVTILSATTKATSTYTLVTDTPNEWEFTFTGTEFDLPAFPSSAHWDQVFGGIHQAVGIDFKWFTAIQHLNGGLGPLVTPSVSGAYGTTQMGSANEAHGSGFDSIEITLTVQDGGAAAPGSSLHVWGDFSGSVHAIHIAPASVPDGGATFGLLGLGFAGLLGLRRKL